MKITEKFASLLEAGSVSCEAVEDLVINENVRSTYHFRKSVDSCLDMAREHGITGKELVYLSNAFTSGLAKRYDKTHFVSEEDFLDFLDEIVRAVVGESLEEAFKKDALPTIATPTVTALLSWIGFSDQNMVNIQKEDLDVENQCIRFRGAAVPVSKRIMDILYAYANANEFYYIAWEMEKIGKYAQTTYLLRSDRQASLSENSIWQRRNRYAELIEPYVRNGKHLFDAETLKINGPMLEIYHWEKKNKIYLNQFWIKESDVQKAIWGEKAAILDNPYNWTSRHYPKFRAWMDQKFNS